MHYSHALQSCTAANNIHLYMIIGFFPHLFTHNYLILCRDLLFDAFVSYLGVCPLLEFLGSLHICLNNIGAAAVGRVAVGVGRSVDMGRIFPHLY